MGKFDKDRHLKELAIRFCIAYEFIPFLEVILKSKSDLSDTIEPLTDIDVLGFSVSNDGQIVRQVFDCKSSGRMSAINRAFWAGGVVKYAGCNGAYVILGQKPVHSHRISALDMGIDIHDDSSFRDLGKSKVIDFDSDKFFQSSLDRWEKVSELLDKLSWGSEIRDLCYNSAPLTKEPYKVFRKLIAEYKAASKFFDPLKNDHLIWFVDALTFVFVLWTMIARDLRRVYDPGITKADFEKRLRYYIWGGRESYEIRQALDHKLQKLRQGSSANFDVKEFPAWDDLVKLAGVVVPAHTDLFDCVFLCREISIRLCVGSDPKKDLALKALLSNNSRFVQFTDLFTRYIVSACGLPSDTVTAIERSIRELR